MGAATGAALIFMLGIVGCLVDTVCGQNCSLGKEAWQWQVSIQRNGIHICGGALISKSWILSSAGCFSSLGNTSEWRVSLRWTNQTNLNISRIIRHPSYSLEISGYDIALVQLNHDISYTNLSIGLPQYSDEVPDGTHCFLSGWEKVDKSMVLPDLQHLQNVSILGSAACNHFFQSKYVSGITFIQEDMLCGEDTSNGNCKGVIGGPLACNIKDKCKLVGILSWTVGCPHAGLGIYTKTTAFLQWIMSNISV
ncbi:tryptase-like [Rhinatrema bivittatum]|uniref:tryptase-like n=1 Tax=Rhinatrema bivittatum TaxID=194408 RepID=UPI001128EB24|nr:tryptase-like [Rhinatrema bivittatum]